MKKLYLLFDEHYKCFHREDGQIVIFESLEKAQKYAPGHLGFQIYAVNLMAVD